MEIYKHWGGKWFLEEVYEPLLKQNEWFYDKRQTPEGYLCWGSNPCQTPNRRRFETKSQACRQAAAFESGLDNSPMYDNMEYNQETGLLMLADVGLMGLFIKDCRCMEEMAKELEKRTICWYCKSGVNGWKRCSAQCTVKKTVCFTTSICGITPLAAGFRRPISTRFTVPR